MVGLSVFCPVGLLSLSFLAILLLLLLDGLSMYDSIEEALNDLEVEVLLGKDERVLLTSPTESLLVLCLAGLCSRGLVFSIPNSGFGSLTRALLL